MLKILFFAVCFPAALFLNAAEPDGTMTSSVLNAPAEVPAMENVKTLDVRPENAPSEIVRLEFDAPVLMTPSRKSEMEKFLLAFPMKLNYRFIRLEILDPRGKVVFKCATPGRISFCDENGKTAGNSIGFSVMTLSSPDADGNKLRLYGPSYEIVDGMPEWEKSFPETLKKIGELNQKDSEKPPLKLLSVKQAEEFFEKAKKLKTDMPLNEVIAILGPPDMTQIPIPKKLLPSGQTTTARYLYYYLYRISLPASPEDILLVFQCDFPDYPNRRKTALKALHTDDEALYIRNVPEEKRAVTSVLSEKTPPSGQPPSPEKTENAVPETLKKLEVKSKINPSYMVRLEFDKPLTLSPQQRKELERFLFYFPGAGCRVLRIEYLDADDNILSHYDCAGNVSTLDPDGKPVGKPFFFPYIVRNNDADGTKVRLCGSDFGKVDGMGVWERNFPDFLRRVEKLNQVKFEQPPVKLLSVEQTKAFFEKAKALKPDMSADEAIAILGKPDLDSETAPRREARGGISILPRSSVRLLYYFFYHVYDEAVGVSDLFVLLQFHYPDPADRTKNNLKTLFAGTREERFRAAQGNTSRRESSFSGGVTGLSLPTEGRKRRISEPRRTLLSDGKTRAIDFNMQGSVILLNGEYPFSSQDFLTRMIPEVQYGTGSQRLSSGRIVRSSRTEGNEPDRLLLNPDGTRRGYPFRLEWLKEEADLEELDLSQIAQMELDSTRLPKLRVLKLGGQISGLEKLDLPALETLEISGTPQPPGGEIRLNITYKTGTPTFPDAPPFRLSRNLPKLKKLVLKGNPGDFDFSTLSDRNLESVSLTYCTAGQFAVFRGQKLKELTFSLYGKDDPKPVADLLAAFPLEKLQFSGKLKDYSFLKNMKLRELFLRPMGDTEVFDPEWLRGQPLEKMTIIGAFGDKFIDWTALKSMPNLRELIFFDTGIADPAALAGLPVEKLSLQQCYFQKPEVLEAVARMPNLQMLNIGRIDYVSPDLPKKNSNINADFQWEKLSRLPLKAFSYWGNRSDFLQSFRSLEYLKITDMSKEGVIQFEDVKCARPLKLLVLNKGVMNTLSQQQQGEVRSTMIQRIQKPEIAERIIVNSTSLFFR